MGAVAYGIAIHFNASFAHRPIGFDGLLNGIAQFESDVDVRHL
jgi:hypothetical protein